jgi:hypothetical protein
MMFFKAMNKKYVQNVTQSLLRKMERLEMFKGTSVLSVGLPLELKVSGLVRTKSGLSIQFKNKLTKNFLSLINYQFLQ